MCHFITAILPTDFDRKDWKPLLKKWKMDFEFIENPYVRKQLRPNERYVRATRNHCDCGTPLTAGSPKNELPKPKNLERKVAKLKKKGWGEKKIETWLQQQKHQEDKKMREALQKPEGEPAGLERWVDFVNDFIESTSLPYIGLLVHWYSGWLNSEQIYFEGNEHIPLADLSTEYLYKMKEDVVYRIGNVE